MTCSSVKCTGYLKNRSWANCRTFRQLTDRTVETTRNFLDSGPNFNPRSPRCESRTFFKALNLHPSQYTHFFYHLIWTRNSLSTKGTSLFLISSLTTNYSTSYICTCFSINSASLSQKGFLTFKITQIVGITKYVVAFPQRLF
jgi:hypothetical protein